MSWDKLQHNKPKLNLNNSGLQIESAKNLVDVNEHEEDNEKVSVIFPTIGRPCTFKLFTESVMNDTDFACWIYNNLITLSLNDHTIKKVRVNSEVFDTVESMLNEVRINSLCEVDWDPMLMRYEIEIEVLP